jgi:hypothetical protein
MGNKAYFWWTANLGVVPLFLFCAFRLAPILRCLAFLRASVTAVLDAIKSSFVGANSLFFRFKRPILLAFLTTFVKAYSQTENTHDLVLAKGEQKELPLEGLKNYSLGNRDVLATKVHKKSLLIKGLKTGFSDLVVWNQAGKIHWRVYVLSQNSFLKTIQLSELLRGLGLKILLNGPAIVASGEISEPKDRLYLKKIEKRFKNQLTLNVTMKSELKNQLLKNIYEEFFKYGHYDVICETQFLNIHCSYTDASAQLTQLTQFLHEKTKADFFLTPSVNLAKNYKIKLKIVQFETNDRFDAGLGLSRIDVPLERLFADGLQALVDTNQMLLKSEKIQMNSLAEPEFITRLNETNTVEVGAQIPFQNLNNVQGTLINSLQWRFAGLKIQCTLKEQFGKIVLNYVTEFSRPVDETISGNKEEASLHVQLGKPLKLFQVDYQSEGIQKEILPWIGKIPILGKLFQSHSDFQNRKRLEGYLHLEEQ